LYTVCVREHAMIAHSLKGEVFGPAQRLHGATYVIDVEFRRKEVDEDGIVVDIGAAAAALHEIIGRIAYRNLDDAPAFTGANTTTEYLARWVFEQMQAAIAGGQLGPGAAALDSLRVVLNESHVAWAAFEGPVTPPR
jgi:6-pyruvoyltetrahydropterin/6-carboxytetrahydropterin synthase